MPHITHFVLKPRGGLAALIVDPAIGVFDVIALDAEGGGVDVCEGEGAGVGHVFPLLIVVCGGQKRVLFIMYFRNILYLCNPYRGTKKQPANFDSGGYSETWLRTLIAEA